MAHIKYAYLFESLVAVLGRNPTKEEYARGESAIRRYDDRALIMENKMVRAKLFSEEYVRELENVLETILDDGTGDVEKPDKRLWPLRADNYRKARRLLDENK